MSVFVLPGEATLVASWRALAHTSRGAAVLETSTSVAAIFPAWQPLNNAIARVAAADVDATTAELARLSRCYADAGVETWAYWVATTARDLDATDAAVVPGLTRDVTTLVMRAHLRDDLASNEDVVSTSIEVAAEAGDEPVALVAIRSPQPSSGLDAWVLVRDGFAVAGLWTYLHDGDCGVYAVGTAPEWRRRGLARSLVEHALADARRRGARTASLQSTPEAVPLYELLGFEPVGRYEEWVRDGGASVAPNQTRPRTSSPSRATRTSP